MATSTTIALMHLQATTAALNATYRALLAPPKAQQWLADQKEVLEQLASDRAAQITEDDLRQQHEDNELEQISHDMNVRGEE